MQTTCLGGQKPAGVVDKPQQVLKQNQGSQNELLLLPTYVETRLDKVKIMIENDLKSIELHFSVYAPLKLALNCTSYLNTFFNIYALLF